MFKDIRKFRVGDLIKLKTMWGETGLYNDDVGLNLISSVTFDDVCIFAGYSNDPQNLGMQIIVHGMIGYVRPSMFEFA